MLMIRGAPLIISVGVLVILTYLILIEQIDDHPGTYKSPTTVVAYSLLKQIEIEKKEFQCEQWREGPAEKSDETAPWIKVAGCDFYVYSVHYDGRLYPYQYVRIIAMFKGTWKDHLFCQVFPSNGTYYVTKAITTKMWSKAWNLNDTTLYYNPYLVSCHLPINFSTGHLSLNLHSCTLNPQRFKVVVPPRDKPSTSFTICVKPLNFSVDVSRHLLQWIAINQVLGAEKFEVYVENLPKKIMQMLEKLGKNGVTLHEHGVIVMNHEFDEFSRMWQRRRYEIITYNDCLYRNIHKSRYIVPVDIDELIVPRLVNAWAELMEDILSKDDRHFASYIVPNAYYLTPFNTAPQRTEVFFLDSIVRSQVSNEGESGKSFVSTQDTLTVFNHYAFRALRPGTRRNKFLKSDVVQMNHYKDNCSVVVLPQCAKYLSSLIRVVDDVILKYRKRFYEQYENVMALL